MTTTDKVVAYGTLRHRCNKMMKATGTKYTNERLSRGEFHGTFDAPNGYVFAVNDCHVLILEAWDAAEFWTGAWHDLSMGLTRCDGSSDCGCPKNASAAPIADAPITLTPASHELFMQFADDAGNWNGMPLVNGNVIVDAQLRGNLTDLVKKGLVTVDTDEDDKSCQWLSFTDEGKAYSAAYGVDLSWA